MQLPPPLDARFARDGVPGHLARVSDGTHVFELNAYRGDKLYGPAEEREERAAAALFPLAPFGRERVVAATTVARTTFDERDCWRVELALDGGRHRTLWFDVTTGLLAGREAEDEALAVYREYRRFEGIDVLLPALERVFRPDGGIEEVFRLERISGGRIGEAEFEPSARIRELLAEQSTK